MAQNGLMAQPSFKVEMVTAVQESAKMVQVKLSALLLWVVTIFIAVVTCPLLRFWMRELHPGDLALVIVYDKKNTKLNSINCIGST